MMPLVVGNIVWSYMAGDALCWLSHKELCTTFNL